MRRQLCLVRSRNAVPEALGAVLVHLNARNPRGQLLNSRGQGAIPDADRVKQRAHRRAHHPRLASSLADLERGGGGLALRSRKSDEQGAARGRCEQTRPHASVKQRRAPSPREREGAGSECLAAGARGSRQAAQVTRRCRGLRRLCRSFFSVWRARHVRTALLQTQLAWLCHANNERSCPRAQAPASRVRGRAQWRRRPRWRIRRRPRRRWQQWAGW